ncbi:MAG: hypothetical protein Q9164_005507 [Protoblastenia rupestris]
MFYRTADAPDWVVLPCDFTREGAPGTANEGRLWEIHFAKETWGEVHVEEYLRTNHYMMSMIAIRLKIRWAPTGSAGVAPGTHHQKKSRIPVDEPDSTPIDPTAESDPNVILPPNPSSLPLARLSNNFREDRYTEILLTFSRSQKFGGSRAWYWPAILEFLTGANSWTSPPTKAATERLRHLLLYQIAELPNTSGAIPLGWRLVPGQERGFWLLRWSHMPPPSVGKLPARAYKAPDNNEAHAATRPRKKAILQEEVGKLRQMREEREKALDAIDELIAIKLQELEDIAEEEREEEEEEEEREERKGQEKQANLA